MKKLIKSLLPDSVVSSYKQQKQQARMKEVFQENQRADDIFLVGHPKSGNTWLGYMLGILVYEDREGEIDLSNVGKYVPTIHNNDHSIAKYPDLSTPRVFRNEKPRFPDLYLNTIYIIRDPRAALVSYYHHCVHDTGRDDWDINDFVDEMIANGCIKSLEPTLERWDKQALKWKQRAKNQKVVFVRYEDLVADREKSMRELVDGLGLKVSNEIVNLAVERGEFSSMRNEEKDKGSESYKGEKGSKGFFVRKGKVDSWKEELPESSQKKIAEAFAEAMSVFNYS